MSAEWEGSERRDHPRVPLHGALHGKIQSAVEAPLVDLSLSGALVEVASALPAASRYAIRLPMESGEPLTLDAEVVRSYVHGFDRQKSGQPAVKYRAALKFVDVDDTQRSAIEAILARGSKAPIQAEISP